MLTRIEQKEQRRKQIFETAVDLFIYKGFHGTKISDIAEAAEMSVGLFFHYYKSKETLFEEILTLCFDGMDRDLNVGSTAYQSLEIILIQTLQHIHQEPLVGKLYVLADQVNYFSKLDPKYSVYLQKSHRYLENTAKLIVQGQMDGKVRKGDPTALAAVFWSAVQGYAQHLVQNPNCPRAQADWFLSIIQLGNEEG